MQISWLYPSLTLLFILLISLKSFPRKAINHKLPPSPARALPILGHLHLLKPPIHRTFQSLAERVGPIFSLRLVNRLVVVVSSPDLVDECFTEKDIVLANRPRLISGEYLGYNYTTLVGASYGDHWRNLRRLATVEVFSAARLNSFESVRLDEIRLLIQKLHRASSGGFARVGLRSSLSEATFNVIMRMVAGKRYFGEGDEEAAEFREMIEEVFSLGGVSNPADFFPVLRWVDYKGYEKQMARVSGKMDAVLQRLIDEQRLRKGGNTMIDHLLSLQEEEPDYYNDVTIKGLILVMLLAGTDTTSVTIEWAMSVLLNNPEKHQKAKIEIDNLVGKDRLINESDVSKLPYLQHIISENFRLFPAAPLLIPHEASTDCTIGGYDIPRGTILMVNAWAIHRDPKIWDDPTSFIPERFESGEVGPTKLMPFGMGRRSCPGMGLAYRVVGLTLGSLIQGFEWQRTDEDLVDLAEGPGTSMSKVIPLEAMCKARDVLQNVFHGQA
ncbi:cytochrome P450- family 81- subfamily D-polypeptide 8 [Striga hermonthica]|uniref:(+)-piperitol/(+)-sesamin synthase n=1 Tax=Striga hermonthica TaxID=68872 RepID=A0A9N7NQY6_STRHE|nr:cytochrome P450- family 81- subfamily D-polypeptide 8 [Striga hermonthica]